MLVSGLDGMRPHKGHCRRPDDDGVSASQKAAGAQYLVIDGAKSDAVSTAVAAVQTVLSATDLVLNGTMVTGGVAYIRQSGGRQVYIVSSALGAVRLTAA